MQIIATKANRDFKIMQGQLEVGKLTYEKWFCKTANTRYRGQHIEIRTKNFWNTKFGIFKNQQEAGLIRFNWKGQAIIRLDEFVDENQEYIVSSKWGWKPHFKVYLEYETLLLTMRSTARWYSSKMAYEIERTQVELPIDEHEFLLYCGFAANVLLANRAAAAG